MKHIISDSAGITLIFTETDLLKEYEAAQELLAVTTYKKIRDRHGIYASNQDKFVVSPNHLNDWDSKIMENLLSSYIAQDKI